MACEFADNGSITVFPLTNFDTPIPFDKNSFDKNAFEDIDTIIGLAVNPLIEQNNKSLQLIYPILGKVRSPKIENIKKKSPYPQKSFKE
jgi:hypothetical protein